MDGGLRVLLSAVLCLSQSLLICCSTLYPVFRSEPTSLIQSPGSVARLRCSASPSSATVSWRFNGLPLNPDTLPAVDLSRGSLTISSLSPRHAGVYQCVARSQRGLAVASRLARVEVAEISEYRDSRRKSLSVQEGSSAVIECPLPPSRPPALPRLRVRGERIEASTGDYLVLPSGNLQIVSVSSRHQGTYKCGAYNPVTGDAVVHPHGTKLTVTSSDSRSPLQIIYPSAAVTLTAQLSHPLTLECVASGSPAATTAKWFKDGAEIPPGPSHELLLHNLVISSVASGDGGIYHCAVETQDEAAVSANYTVDVQEAVSFVNELEDVRVFPGTGVRFTCGATGHPSPNITWLFNADPITPSSHPALVLGRDLVMENVTKKDQGVYQCLVDNRISSAQSAGLLTLRSDSEAPPSPTIHPMQSDEGHDLFLTEEDVGHAPVNQPTNRGGERLTPEAPIITSPPQTHKPDVYDLEWRAGQDGGSPINAYFVKYRKVDDMGTVVGSWSTVRVPGSEKTLRLSELEPSSLYEVLMVARSSAGEGQPAMLTFRTGKEKTASTNKSPSKPPVVPLPPKIPEDKTPNTHFGVIIHDRVSKRHRMSPPPLRFRLACVSLESQPLNPSRLSPAVPEAPDRPTIYMATESSVYVTWIPRANGGSPITAFRVEYRRGRSAEWVVAADNISPLKLSVEVRNLEPGSTYRFRVAAMNMYGESPHSIPSKPYQVPQASSRMADRPVVGPHISSTDAISDTQIMLRWTYSPSSNNNTPIQGFYIYYRPTDSDNDSDYKRDVVEVFKHWHMIAHLQPETSYDIKMQCYNDGGESEYSNVMICETKARQSPGSHSQHPVTPPGTHPPESHSSSGSLLYLIVGIILVMMVLILLAFIAMCLRHRQQNSMHKYDPPGYLYQPADVNGHVLEYSALNGGVHGGYGHGGTMVPPGCPHLHHKLPNGLTLLNGSGGLFPHSHDGGREHPHHHHNGGGLYSALPQSETPDCLSHQNHCNNNRCYKNNSTLPLVHRVAPCQQDGLEMVPLGQVSSPCRGHYGHDGEADAVDRLDQDWPPVQVPYCAVSDDDGRPADENDEDPDRVDSDSVVSWETLGLPDLDCDEKPAWISSSSLAGELIQPGPQEVQ